MQCSLISSFVLWSASLLIQRTPTTVMSIAWDSFPSSLKAYAYLAPSVVRVLSRQSPWSSTRQVGSITTGSRVSSISKKQGYAFTNISAITSTRGLQLSLIQRAGSSILQSFRRYWLMKIDRSPTTLRKKYPNSRNLWGSLRWSCLFPSFWWTICVGCYVCTICPLLTVFGLVRLALASQQSSISLRRRPPLSSYIYPNDLLIKNQTTLMLNPPQQLIRK